MGRRLKAGGSGGVEGPSKRAEQRCRGRSAGGVQRAAAVVRVLLAFETATGEQWLAFRDDGKYSAADYAKITSERQLKEQYGDTPFWNPFNRAYKLELRRYFVLKLLNAAMSGLLHMHNQDRLHQSLGPSSVILKYSSVDCWCWSIVGRAVASSICCWSINSFREASLWNS